MLSWIKRRARRKRNAHDLYGSIVALSRSPELYAEMGVPDTVEGRFEMLVFHLFACLDRIGQIPGGNAPLAQDLVDMFFSDMETTSRELGVGDMSVPKKMKTLARVYDERMRAYRQATEMEPENALAQALASNIFMHGDARMKSSRLEKYVRNLKKSLLNTEIADLEAGQIRAHAAPAAGGGCA